MPENFIVSFDNFLNDFECQTYIDYFEKLKSLGLTHTRQETGDMAHYREDEAVYLMQHEILMRPDNPLSNIFLSKFWDQYQRYADKFSTLKETQKHTIHGIKIQKTLPSQGYHIWHYESSKKSNSSRILAFNVFLNTVEQGGETEFLYQQIRVNSEKGKLTMWPAGFTHTHRGNPPLSGEKYILTGWIEFA